MQQTYGFAPAHSFPFMFFGFFGILLTILVLTPYWFIFKEGRLQPISLAADVHTPDQHRGVVLSGFRAVERGSHASGLSDGSGSLSAPSLI
jgi:hypothetical protein